MKASPYRRVILKLSGEALGLDGKLFCHEKFEQVARMLIDIQHTGVELAVVIGGGNVWRGRRGAAMRMGTVAADQMGMLATLQNCLFMRDTLDHLGARAVVMSGVDIPRFAESYNTVAAIEHLRAGRILYQCEDLGRHNALDKAVGCALADGVPLGECVLYTSGRVPVDMVRKAIRAGVPALVSKTMPTVQSVELAEEYGLRLFIQKKNEFHARIP